MNTTGWVTTIVVIILIALGAWWFVSTNNPAPGQQGSVATSTDQLTGTVVAPGDTDTGSTTPKTVSVFYNGESFSPKTVTVNAGDTVNFSSVGAPMWVAADEHPTHTEFDGTSRATHCAAGYTGVKPFDQCGNGTSYSFTFTKAGTFEYHNHSAAQFGGTVIVK